MAQSTLLKLRHYNYTSCASPIVTTPGNGSSSETSYTLVTSCSWSGNDFSPATPPSSSCSEGRQNQKESNQNGIEYTCTCTQINTGKTPSEFEPTPPATGQTTGQCQSKGTSLVKVATELPQKAFPRTNYHPLPNQVYSFSFKTVPQGETTTGILSVALLSSSSGGKLVVVSTCPGDVETAGKDAGCYHFGAETSSVSFVVNSTSRLKPEMYCNLKPNTQYYFNVVPRESSNGPSNCTAAANCGFSFLGR